jgi:hypothetical protein
VAAGTTRHGECREYPGPRRPPPGAQHGWTAHRDLFTCRSMTASRACHDSAAPARRRVAAAQPCGDAAPGPRSSRCRVRAGYGSPHCCCSRLLLAPGHGVYCYPRLVALTSAGPPLLAVVPPGPAPAREIVPAKHGAGGWPRRLFEEVRVAVPSPRLALALAVPCSLDVARRRGDSRQPRCPSSKGRPW